MAINRADLWCYLAASLHPRAGRWFAEVYDGLTGPGFRVPRPVRAVTGDWVAQGWTASCWVAGIAADWSGVSPRWPELIAVSRALHAALAGAVTICFS